MEFVQALYDQKIVFSFDWMRRSEEAQQYVAEPEKIERADLITLRKLLTTHVRADRFFEGHLSEMLENGQITAALRRLQELGDQLGNERPDLSSDNLRSATESHD